LIITKLRTMALACVGTGCIASFLFLVPSGAQSQSNSREGSAWKDKLYEENVIYEKSACGEDDSKVVGAFFLKHPLRSLFPICHNDCPIIECRPVVHFPPLAKQAKVSGTVSVHVLVNEEGRVLYARILSGNPLLWAAVRKGACETQFKEYPYGKHQGVMHFTVDGYQFLNVPNTANQVH
jgi:hypothetical protein